MEGAAGSVGFRSRAAGGRGVHRCQHVPDQGRDRGDAAPGRGARAGLTLVMSFMLPIELADPEVRPGIERAEAGARANGTPFISFFTPSEMLTLARDAGFKEVQHVSAATLAQGYFAGRTDGLRPPNNSEELVVATT